MIKKIFIYSIITIIITFLIYLIWQKKTGKTLNIYNRAKNFNMKASDLIFAYLIIKNKDSFLNHLCKIRDVLSKVLIEYINFILLNNLNKNRIDPSRQQVRRKGFSLINKDLINKEMFLNTQNVGEPEKGILI